MVEQAQVLVEQLEELDTVDQYCQLAHEKTIYATGISNTTYFDVKFCNEQIQSKRLGCAHNNEAISLVRNGIHFLLVNKCISSDQFANWLALLDSGYKGIEQLDISKSSAEEIVFLGSSGLEDRFADDVGDSKKDSETASVEHDIAVAELLSVKDEVLTALKSAVHK